MNVGTYGVQDGSAGETPVRFSQHTNKQTYNNGHNVHWSQNNVRLVQPGPNLDEINEYGKRFLVPVVVNGRHADAIRDSAADYCLIHPRVVQGIPRVIGSKARIQCALGIVRTIPTCKINISSPRFENGREFQVIAGIVDGLPYDVILGSNLYIENPSLSDIISTGKGYDRNEQAQTETRKNEQTSIRQSPRDRRTKTALPVKAAIIAISDESRGDGALHGRTINDCHKERMPKEAEDPTGADKQQGTADYDKGGESDNENDNATESENDHRQTSTVSNLTTKQVAVDGRGLGDYALVTTTIDGQMQTAGPKGTLGNIGTRTNKEGVGVNRGRPRRNWNIMVGAGKEQMGHRESSQRSHQSNWRDKLLTETRYNGRETYRRYQRNGPRNQKAKLQFRGNFQRTDWRAKRFEEEGLDWGKPGNRLDWRATSARDDHATGHTDDGRKYGKRSSIGKQNITDQVWEDNHIKGLWTNGRRPRNEINHFSHHYILGKRNAMAHGFTSGTGLFA